MPLCLSEFDGAYNEAWPQQIRQNAAIFCDWLVAEFEAVIVYFLQASFFGSSTSTANGVLCILWCRINFINLRSFVMGKQPSALHQQFSGRAPIKQSDWVRLKVAAKPLVDRLKKQAKLKTRVRDKYYEERIRLCIIALKNAHVPSILQKRPLQGVS